jgi:hypothetical protein
MCSAMQASLDGGSHSTAPAHSRLRMLRMLSLTPAQTAAAVKIAWLALHLRQH